MTTSGAAAGRTALGSQAEHWDRVYRQRREDELSWHEDVPETSLALVGDDVPAHAEAVDVGAGTSCVAEALLARGFAGVTVLDISAEALERTRQRLGDRAAHGRLVRADVLAWQPDRPYDLWHDRAVLHFLTDPGDRSRYADVAATAVRPGGLLVLGGFAPDGPEQCSGLPVARRSAAELAVELGPAFVLEHAEHRLHRTPAGVEQAFTWVRMRRTESPFSR